MYLLPGLVLRLRWLFLIFFVALAGWAAVSEMRSGHFQPLCFQPRPRHDLRCREWVQPGYRVSKDRPL